MVSWEVFLTTLKHFQSKFMSFTLDYCSHQLPSVSASNQILISAFSLHFPQNKRKLFPSLMKIYGNFIFACAVSKTFHLLLLLSENYLLICLFISSCLTFSFFFFLLEIIKKIFALCDLSCDTQTLWFRMFFQLGKFAASCYKNFVKINWKCVLLFKFFLTSKY